MENSIIKLNPGELLPIKSDMLYHDLFNDHDMDSIKWIISQILKCNPKSIEDKIIVKNTRLTRISPKETGKYADLVIQYDKYIFVLELNNNYNGNYLRNYLYANNILLNSYIKKDKSKEKSKKVIEYYNSYIEVILVNLNWYRKRNDNYVVKENDTIVNDDGKVILKIVNVNLDKYVDKDYNEVMKYEKFYKLLTITKEEELEEIVKHEPLLTTYFERLKIFSREEEKYMYALNPALEQRLFDMSVYQDGLEDGIEQGIQTGIQTGIQQGILQNQKEMVLNMYNDKVSISTISRYANISVDEVKDIVNKSL